MKDFTPFILHILHFFFEPRILSFSYGLLGLDFIVGNVETQPGKTLLSGPIWCICFPDVQKYKEKFSNVQIWEK